MIIDIVTIVVVVATIIILSIDLRFLPGTLCFMLNGAAKSVFVPLFSLLLQMLQVDKEEVRLRRTIGLKKDEYFLDGKHITWVSSVSFTLFSRKPFASQFIDAKFAVFHPLQMVAVS